VAGYFFLGLVDPSRNRLASTAYFAIILGGILSGVLLNSYRFSKAVPGALFLVQVSSPESRVNSCTYLCIAKRVLLICVVCSLCVSLVYKARYLFMYKVYFSTVK